MIKTIAIGHFLAHYYSDLDFIQNFHNYLENPTNQPQYLQPKGNFGSFLQSFGVLKRIRNGRKTLQKVYNTTARNVNGLTVTVDKVNTLAQCLKRYYTHGLEVSLASKILFLNSPCLITPLDAFTKTALRMNNNNYTEFITRFQSYNNDNFLISNILGDIEPLTLPIEGHFFNLGGFINQNNINSIKQNRLKDKILWVIGKHRLEECYHTE